MSAVDEFLRSTREALRPHANTGEGALVVLVCLVVLGLLAWWRHRRRRRQETERRFLRLMNERQLASDNVTLLRSLAEEAGVTPLEVATQIEVFERATAIAIRHVPKRLVGEEKEILGRIHLLRRHLGFGEVPEHFALRTTRELTPGLAIECGDTAMPIIAVTEAFFSLHAPQRPDLKLGSTLELTLVRGREARDTLRCELLGMEALPSHGPDACKLLFAHDESPARVQRRAFVRVGARGAMALKRTTADHAMITGTIVDISVGGAAVETDVELGAGEEVLATFTLNSAAFADVRASVLSAQPVTTGRHHVRLKFDKLSIPDEDRLAAAVVHHTTNAVANEPRGA
ncbi:MAG TPA: PilZ domain-containing protein [Polyangia bacterium]